jgi:hypothetical protein
MGAKAYASNHTNILFFLWYWLYVPVLIFVSVAFVWDYGRTIKTAIAGLGGSRQQDFQLTTSNTGECKSGERGNV